MKFCKLSIWSLSYYIVRSLSCSIFNLKQNLLRSIWKGSLSYRPKFWDFSSTVYLVWTQLVSSVSVNDCKFVCLSLFPRDALAASPGCHPVLIPASRGSSRLLQSHNQEGAGRRWRNNYISAFILSSLKVALRASSVGSPWTRQKSRCRPFPQCTEVSSTALWQPISKWACAASTRAPRRRWWPTSQKTLCSSWATASASRSSAWQPAFTVTQCWGVFVRRSFYTFNEREWHF